MPKSMLQFVRSTLIASKDQAIYNFFSTLCMRCNLNRPDGCATFYYMRGVWFCWCCTKYWIICHLLLVAGRLVEQKTRKKTKTQTQSKQSTFLWKVGKNILIGHTEKEIRVIKAGLVKWLTIILTVVTIIPS